MRYKNTERLGVIETDRIVTKDLGWIFREQPIIDVGLDAIVEKVNDNNPTGQFLALQIKTGEGNFYRQDKFLTHYISGIHYNYWMCLSMPIILIAHLPENELTFWVEINKYNIKKTKKKWKIDIPLNQHFNDKSKRRLDGILSKAYEEGKYKIINEIENIDLKKVSKIIDESITDIVTSSGCITKMNESMRTLSTYTNETAEKVNKINPGIDNDRLNNIIESYSNKMNLESRKLEKEIINFSRFYSKGTIKLNNVLLKLFSKSPNYKNLIDISVLYSVYSDTEHLLKVLEGLRNSANALSFKLPIFKEAKKQHIEVIDLIIFEFIEANLITNDLINTIENN